MYLYCLMGDRFHCPYVCLLYLLLANLCFSSCLQGRWSGRNILDIVKRHLTLRDANPLPKPIQHLISLTQYLPAPSFLSHYPSLPQIILAINGTLLPFSYSNSAFQSCKIRITQVPPNSQSSSIAEAAEEVSILIEDAEVCFHGSDVGSDAFSSWGVREETNVFTDEACERVVIVQSRALV